METLAKLFVLSLFLVTTALAQVTSAEVQSVEATAAKSAEGTAAILDESIGEVRVLIIATDEAGNPVEGATVSWTVQNNGSDPVYVLSTSGMMDMDISAVDAETELMVEGGVTDANGEAYIIVDSEAAGDSKVFVMIDEVEGKTYDGRDMRVVWF